MQRIPREQEVITAIEEFEKDICTVRTWRTALNIDSLDRSAASCCW